MFRRAILESGAWTNPGWKLLTQEEAVSVGRHGARWESCDLSTPL